MNLLAGERLHFSGKVASLPSTLTADEINEKYARGDVRIVTEQARYPLSTIVTMLKSGDYNLNPEFQRRHRWNRYKQSRLIESFIMNVPIPPIFLYEVKYSQYEVMDGLQRLTAISDFYSDQFALESLDQWPELNGLRYSKLPEQVRRGVDRRYLSSIILLQETAQTSGEAERLKQLVFERINSGGEKLEAQESRNALHNGPLNRLCIELARTTSFCTMWGIPTDESMLAADSPQQVLDLSFEFEEPEAGTTTALLRNPLYQKMQDVELVLRFFAFRQFERIEQGRLRDFLDEYMRLGNDFRPDVLDDLESLFVRTSNLVYDVLGEQAFYLVRRRRNAETGWNRFIRPTKVLYDPMMYVFSQYVDRAGDLIAKAEEIRDGLEGLYKDNPDAFKGRFNREDISERNRLVDKFILGFLG